MAKMQNLALYVHWPFCLKKCPYCDFNSHVAENQINENIWLEAYIKELDYRKKTVENSMITSIFFGGGTPSLMPINVLDTIMSHISKNYNLSEDIEITLEANPTSFETEKFRNFKKTGINRISLGIQALNNRDLRFLGREHNVTQALQSLDSVANIFDSYSFDLIYARPNQSLEAWQKELEQALKLVKNHISLYQLTIEKGTKLYQEYQQGKFQLPNEEDAALMYETTAKMLGRKEIYAYEISNYAKINHHSKHNMSYWNYRPYLGIGAGAHSRLRNESGSRQEIINFHKPDKWLKSVIKNGHAMQTNNRISGNEMVVEMVMMGLRTAIGINKQYFKQETNQNINDVINSENLQYLINQNLISEDDEFIRLTTNGFLLHQAIVNKLLTL